MEKNKKCSGVLCCTSFSFFLSLFSFHYGFRNPWMFFRVELCSLNGLFYEENEAHPLLFPFALRALCFYVLEIVDATLAHWVKLD